MFCDLRASGIGSKIVLSMSTINQLVGEYTIVFAKIVEFVTRTPVGGCDSYRSNLQSRSRRVAFVKI